MMKKIVLCLFVSLLVACSVGGGAAVGGGSNGVGASFGLGTGISF